MNFMQLELLRAIRKEFHATQIELHATPRTFHAIRDELRATPKTFHATPNEKFWSRLYIIDTNTNHFYIVWSVLFGCC